MTLTLIAAVSDDGYISKGTGVPWSLPDDVSHFRSYCAGKWLLVGRLTYQEMTGWFRPDHTPLVVTSDVGFKAPVGQSFSSPQEAINHAAQSTDELVVIGGASLYQSVFADADQLVITHVHTRLSGGKAFPQISPHHWRQNSSTFHPQDARHLYSFTIATYSTSTLRRNV